MGDAGLDWSGGGFGLLLGLALAAGAFSPALALGGYEVPNVFFSVRPDATIDAKALNQPAIVRRDAPKMMLADTELGQKRIYFIDQFHAHECIITAIAGMSSARDKGYTRKSELCYESLAEI